MAIDHVARAMAMDAGGNTAPVDVYTKTETDELLGQKADKSEVTESVTAAVAQIVADAPEDFNTLREMSDWITQHEDSAAAMNTAILQNAADIEAVETQQADIQEQIDGITNQIFWIGTKIPDGADLNDYTQPGVYYVSDASHSKTILNNPHKTSGFRLEVVRIQGNTSWMQMLYPNSMSAGVFYNRTNNSSGIGSWFKYQGVAATT